MPLALDAVSCSACGGVQVKDIQEMGAYVSLLEYNNIEGMILLSELSRRRIRSISSLIKVGRQEPVMVVRVDKNKGYIDLSKRRVSEEEVAACEEKYNKSKMVHSIMRHTAETCDIDLEVPASPLLARPWRRLSRPNPQSSEAAPSRAERASTQVPTVPPLSHRSTKPGPWRM